MFRQLAESSSRYINVLIQSLETNESLRAFQSAFVDDGSPLAARASRLVDVLPALQDWRVYEHCGAVTRLYAIFENFSELLVARWLGSCPQIWPRYSVLAKNIREKHRSGVASVLNKLGHRRYRHLTEDDVLKGLAAGASDRPYSLLPAAFVHSDSNLRFAGLCALLESCGIQGASAWLSASSELSAFFRQEGEAVTLAEGRLDELVEFRNDAAHGAADEILSVDQLLYFCRFLEALIHDVAELANHAVIKEMLGVGLAIEVGQVTEVFKGPQAAVAVIEHGSISVGDDLFLYKVGTATPVRVQEVKWHGVSVNSVIASSAVEVGVKLTTLPARGVSIVRLSDGL